MNDEKSTPNPIIGLNAIAEYLDLDLPTTKQHIKRGDFEVWKERGLTVANREDLHRFKQSLPESVWHIKTKDGNVIVYRGVMEGIWDQDQELCQIKRYGLILEEQRIGDLTFCQFLTKLQNFYKS